MLKYSEQRISAGEKKTRNQSKAIKKSIEKRTENESIKGKQNTDRAIKRKSKITEKLIKKTQGNGARNIRKK